jgi:hypothetical protein
MTTKPSMAQPKPSELVLSLRAWPKEDKEQNQLKNLVARMHKQYNGFRNITEEKLEEELTAAGGAEGGTESVEAATQEDDSPSETIKGSEEYVFVQKMKMKQHLEYVNCTKHGKFLANEVIAPPSTKPS